MTKKTVYISGPISGLDPITARNNFTNAKLRLIADAAKKSPRVDEQVSIVNPMDMADWGFSWETYMEIAKTILRSGEIDAIYMMAEWESSEGAKIEHRIAEKEGIEILYEEAPEPSLKERRKRPYDAMGDDQGRGGYTADEAYRKEFVEKYYDQEEEG